MAASSLDPVTAEDVLTMQFTLIKKGGYDSQEVDAFLDRVAATLDQHRGRLPESAMSADDVRTAEFSLVKRGGYDTREVDDFLDRVVAVLSAVPAERAPLGNGFVDDQPDPAPAAPVAQSDPMDPAIFDDEMFGGEPEPEPAREPAPSRAPAQVTELPDAAPPPPQSPPSAGAAVSGGSPQLHDPEGAAQRLLAAAQQAADTLTAEARTYSETARREADEYARATRSEADEHAERVTTSAEAQAASIREVAADEARRVAEEARSRLVEEMASLEARKVELEGAVAALESEVGSHRSRLLATIDDLRAKVSDELVAGEEPDSAPSTASLAAAVGAADEPTQAVDMTHFEHADIAETADDLVADDGADDGGADEYIVEAADDQDAAAVASRSVFDIADDDTDASSTDWLDDEIGDLGSEASAAEDDTGDITADPGDPGDTADTGDDSALFDLEADEPSAEAPASSSGDSFFDELRQADDDGGLGPLDEDTDAALSAFFDAEEEDAEERWRDRFGPS